MCNKTSGMWQSKAVAKSNNVARLTLKQMECTDSLIIRVCVLEIAKFDSCGSGGL